MYAILKIITLLNLFISIIVQNPQRHLNVFLNNYSIFQPSIKY